MVEIERLVLSAEFGNTLCDVVAAFGAQLRELSPEAKRRIRKSVFGNKPPAANVRQVYLDAWEAIQ